MRRLGSMLASKPRPSTLWTSYPDQLEMPQEARAILELLVWALLRLCVLAAGISVTAVIGRILSDELENTRCAGMDEYVSFAEHNGDVFWIEWPYRFVTPPILGPVTLSRTYHDRMFTPQLLWIIKLILEIP